MPDVTIRLLDLDRDADRIADMWNASNSQWPATWTRGATYTGEIIREQHQENRYAAVFVAEVDGLIAGYCSFMDGGYTPYTGEGYLAVLNVRPEYQGLSIGRRLIQATIAHSVERGWKRQTLGTWSANFKAVPTYKKTGHFWTPDTSVFMQNFIPGALQMPLAQPFFTRHDWYDSYVPAIAQCEDSERWEGLKVFRQHWEADGECLTIWIDREARAPVAVETNDLFLAAIPEQIEPLAGSAVSLRWKVANRRSQTLRVALYASGDSGLGIDHRASFIVSPGETVERAASVLVAEDAPRAEADGTAPAVRTILRLDEGLPGEQEVELFTGLRARKPLTLDTYPSQLSLCPGRAASLDLQLHSAVDEPLDVNILLTPPVGLVVEQEPEPVHIPPRGHVSLPLVLKADAQSLYRLPVTIQWSDSMGNHTLQETLSLPSVLPGGLLTDQSSDAVTLETDNLCVTAHALNGVVAIEDKRLHTTVMSLVPMLGAPYYPPELGKVRFTLDLQHQEGRAIVRMVGQSQVRQGLFLHQTLAFSTGGFLTLDQTLENRSLQDQTVRFRLSLRSGARDRERVTVPLAVGMIQAPAFTYPVPWNDAPRDVSGYAEPWMAWDRKGSVTAVAWRGVDQVTGHAQMIGLDGPEITLSPGRHWSGPSYAFHIGDGDWRQARHALAYWAALPAELPATLAPRPRTHARLEPRVIVTTAERAEATLRIDTGSIRAVDGDVDLDLGAGMRLDPPRTSFQGLTRDTPQSVPVRVTLPPGWVGSSVGHVRLEATLNDSAAPFAVVRLGTPGAVNISRREMSGQEVWEIDNGHSLFRVAPGFGPSVIAWEVDGVNHLVSAFPVAQGLAFNYPWFGGICPQLFPSGLGTWAGCIYGDACSAEPCAFSDARGLLWQGVRLGLCPAREDLHDLYLELDYATVGESNVLRVAHRLKNLRPTTQGAQLTSYVFAGLGGQPKDLVLRGPHIVARPNPVMSFAHDQPWGALVRPVSGECLLMVGERGGVSLIDWGQDGRSLGSTHECRLAGHEVYEEVFYLALTDSLDDAQGYTMLAPSCGQPKER